MSAPLGSLGHKSAGLHNEANEAMRCNARPRKWDETYVKLTFFLSSSGAMLLRLPREAVFICMTECRKRAPGNRVM